MFSSPSSPSVLASTSRHNIIQAQPHSQLRQQKSLRLFLGHQSDEEAATSECDFDFSCYNQHRDDDDSDSDGSVMGVASGSTPRLQPGRLPIGGTAFDGLESPSSRRKLSHCAYDEGEAGLFRHSSPSKRLLKRSQPGTSLKKAAILTAAKPTKHHAAVSAAIPTTPSKRQKSFLVRGNVTPSRAFSIFTAAKQRSKQRQQHGLMTPPTSSPLRPIILDTFDHEHDDYVDSSPSRSRARRSNGLASPSSSDRSRSKPYILTQGSQGRSAYSSPTTPRAFQPSAFGPGHSDGPSLPHTLHGLRTRQSHLVDNGPFPAPRALPAARAPTFDTTSFLETFVSPSSCVHQIPRSADDEILSHPICAAYSYSSRSVNPSAQWLAVGDDEGRITLLNTLPWQDASAESYSANPQWQASSSSAIFELAWRFDDRSILSGASDFSIRSWDTEYQKCTGRFQGHRGSPRTIVYDPTTNGDGGCGMVFASAGRDGTIRIWDARISSRSHGTDEEDDEDGVGISPVLTIDAAHSTLPPAPTAGVVKGRKQMRNGTLAGARGRKRLSMQPLPAGITALSYLPDGQGHKLLSGGSANGIIKCWDLRHVRRSHPSDPVSEVDTQKALERPITSLWDTPDISLLAPAGSFARAHGVSQIISSTTNLYASCTGGKIYSLPLSAFLDSRLVRSEVQTLYDPVQCQNTLFSRMALFDDRFLAVGCNTGNVALWDVTASRTSRQGREDATAGDVEEERRVARQMEVGFAASSQQRGIAILTEGHTKNTEVNAVAWANGPHGPTLSSVGDDTKIRTWFADRTTRDGIVQAADE
ncbi:WD_REPEATS_REGION domain-containing protein [Pseudozyma hubeiensis]|nr:WD_REPEATS_REGION domain-containing protein [Pseudozyma hubeiensis]